MKGLVMVFLMLPGLAMHESRRSADTATTVEDRLKAYEDAFYFEKKMHEDYSLAMQLTAEHYHLTPRETSGHVARPKDPLGRGEWATGLPVVWAPAFLYDTKDYRKVKGVDGKEHFLGGEIPLAETGGVTYVSGQTAILRQGFEDAFNAGNPGPLAFLIHHEVQHFEELIGRGWDNYEEGEARVYKSGRKLADVFELSASAKDKIDEKIGEYHRKLASEKRSSLFPSAGEEAKNRLSLEEAERQRAEFEWRFDALKGKVEEERKEREDRKRQALLDSVRVGDSDYFAAIARQLCQDPGSQTQEGLDWSWKRIQDNLHVSYEMEARSRGLGVCETKVFVYLFELRGRQGRPDASAIVEFARWAHSDAAWDAMWSAASGVYEMAAALCRDPGARQDFTRTLREAESYANGYDRFYSYVRELTLGRSGQAGACAAQVIEEVLPQGLPLAGRSWNLTLEEFRVAARRHAPVSGGAGATPPRDGGDNNGVGSGGSGGPDVPDCIRREGGRCITR